jgi:hypothetical protein
MQATFSHVSKATLLCPRTPGVIYLAHDLVVLISRLIGIAKKLHTD